MVGPEYNSKSQVKVIIFDCWNTLFTTRPAPGTATRLSQAVLHHNLSYRFLKMVEKNLMLSRHDDLSIPARQILKDMHLPAPSPLVRRLEHIITQSVRHQRPFTETLEVLTLLKQRYRLGMISNTFHQSFQPLRQNFELEDHFEYIFPSYEVGMIKPDPAIFRLALKAFGVQPREAVMVGDNYHDDFLAAQSVGMPAVLIDRSNRWHTASPRVTSLTQLETLLENRFKPAETAGHTL